MTTDQTDPRDALARAFLRSDMTREDFARRILGVTPSAVWRWQAGRRVIPKTVQDRIAHYLTEGV